MAPHLTDAELDWMHARLAGGRTVVDIHASLALKRERAHMEAPHLTNVRLALKGKTYRRGLKETRGRPTTYSNAWVRTLNATRKTLLKTTDGDREVRWRDVQKKARAPKVGPLVCLRALIHTPLDARTPLMCAMRASAWWPGRCVCVLWIKGVLRVDVVRRCGASGRCLFMGVCKWVGGGWQASGRIWFRGRQWWGRGLCSL